MSCPIFSRTCTFLSELPFLLHPFHFRHFPLILSFHSVHDFLIKYFWYFFSFFNSTFLLNFSRSSSITSHLLPHSNSAPFLLHFPFPSHLTRASQSCASLGLIYIITLTWSCQLARRIKLKDNFSYKRRQVDMKIWTTGRHSSSSLLSSLLLPSSPQFLRVDGMGGDGGGVGKRIHNHQNSRYIIVHYKGIINIKKLILHTVPIPCYSHSPLFHVKYNSFTFCVS